MVAAQSMAHFEEEARSKMLKRGDVVIFIDTYELFKKNVKDMKAMVVQPYTSFEPKRHLLYVPEVGEYCEPLEELVQVCPGETMSHPDGFFATMGERE